MGNTHTIANDKLTSNYRRMDESNNVTIDLSKYVDTLRNLDKDFSLIKKRTMKKMGWVDRCFQQIGEETIPKYEVVTLVDNFGNKTKKTNAIDKIAFALNEISKEAFTFDYWDGGACVIGMDVKVKVVFPRKQKAEQITLVRQYGQGEAFNYVYQKRIVEMINTYMPNLAQYVFTDCGRMD